jgi:hypothetical protein
MNQLCNKRGESISLFTNCSRKKNHKKDLTRKNAILFRAVQVALQVLF